MSRFPVLALFAAFAAVPAFAQSRGPVVPNFQQPEKQAPAPAPASDIDLVGPTAAQQARAKAAADAKAKADAEARAAADKKAREEAEARLRAQADAMARADAEARAKAEADARAKADADARARAEIQARAKAEADAIAAKKRAADEAVAAHKRAIEEAKARARAAAEDARQKALEAELARRRAIEQAKAAARAAADAKKKMQEELAAQAREAARAKKAAAEVRAQAKALVTARKREETRCRQGKKAKQCLARVAAKYDPPALPLPAAAPEPLALAPLIATPPPVAAAPAPAPALALAPAPARAPAPAATTDRKVLLPGAPTVVSAGDRNVLVPAPPASTPVAVPVAPAPVAPPPARPAAAVVPGTRVATVAPVANAILAVPRDEQPRRPRTAEVVNELQLGPQSLILDNLLARGEIIPGSLQLDFGYRLALDDAAAPHHLFSAGLESARCSPGDACGLRWFVRGGLGPHNASDFKVDRKVNGVTGVHKDTLGWSANVVAAGLGYTGATLSLLADAQLEALTEEYLRNVDLASPPRVNGSVNQLRLRATAGATSGALSGQLRLAKYSYSGASTDTLKDVPMRGALIEDDLPGLAGALQSFSARLDGRWESRGGLQLSATYAYLGYAGPLWSSAHIFAGSVSQRLGRFRIGIGIVGEQEYDAKGLGYPTVFGTGSLGAAF